MMLRRFVPDAARWYKTAFTVPLPDADDSTIVGVVATIFTAMTTNAAFRDDLCAALQREDMTITSNGITVRLTPLGVTVTKGFGFPATDFSALSPAERLQHHVTHFAQWQSWTAAAQEAPALKAGLAASYRKADEMVADFRAEMAEAWRTAHALKADLADSQTTVATQHAAIQALTAGCEDTAARTGAAMADWRHPLCVAAAATINLTLDLGVLRDLDVREIAALRAQTKEYGARHPATESLLESLGEEKDRVQDRIHRRIHTLRTMQVHLAEEDEEDCHTPHWKKRKPSSGTMFA